MLADDVRAQFERAIGRLQTAGARVEETAVRHAGDIAPAYLTIIFSDVAAYHAATLDAMPDRYTAPVRTRLEVGRYVLAEDLARALNVRNTLRRDVDAALAGFDALLLPTMPITAPVLGQETMQVGSRAEPVRSLMLRNTQLFNLSGHPAVSLPCGTAPDGFPCALQLVGASGGTADLLRVALACERALS